MYMQLINEIEQDRKHIVEFNSKMKLEDQSI